MTDFPMFKTPRCTLNRITDEDIPVMRQIFDDNLTRKFLPELMPLVRTNNGIQMILSAFDSYLAQNEGAIWGIRLGSILIGFVAFMDLSFNPTIFFATHPRYRMKGYMKESIVHTIRFILDHSFVNSFKRKCTQTILHR